MLTRINPKHAVYEGTHEIMKDVRGGHLGKENPLAKIQTEGAEVSHLGMEALKGFIGI